MRARLLCVALGSVCAGIAPLDAQARWSLVETLRIGSESDGPYLFTSIRGVAVGEGGSVFVLDFRTQEIRLFDRDGTFLKRVARTGSGPGEIRNANGLLNAPDGRVWVNDPNNSRYTIFAGNGEFASQHRYSVWGYGFTWQGMFDRTGALVEPISVTAGNTRTPKLRRVSPDGAKVDTIASPECANRASKEESAGFVGRAGTATHYYGVPFLATPIRAFDPGGFVWCSSNDRYEILKIRLVRGDTVLRVTASRPPLRITDEEREAAIAPIRTAFGRIGQPAPDFGLVPRVRPPLQALDVDDSGRLWVRAATNDTTQTVFEVWDGNTGRQLATVTAPWRISAAWRPLFRGDTVHTVVLDENEVPVVARAVLKKTP